MNKICVLLLSLLVNLSIQGASDSKSDSKEIPGLNIRDAGLMAVERLGGTKRIELQALIDSSKWVAVQRRLPKDLLDKYIAYVMATKVKHAPR